MLKSPHKISGPGVSLHTRRIVAAWDLRSPAATDMSAGEKYERRV